MPMMCVVYLFFISEKRYIYNVHFIMQMVLPTILKRHHSLKGVKLLQAIRKIKLGQPESLKEYMCVSPSIKGKHGTSAWLARGLTTYSKSSMWKINNQTGIT
jgi:hypothetical protein